jgi:pilus assembly protein CpaF
MNDQDPLDYALVQTLQAEVARQIGIQAQLREARGERELSPADEQQLAISLIETAVASHLQRRVLGGGDVALDRRYDQRVANGVYSAMFGAGELQELLDDPTVENININGADEVWVTYAGNPQPHRHRPMAATDEDLISIIQGQAAHAGINARPWTPATPELDLRLSDGSRLSAVMGAGERPSVSIRRNRFPQMMLPKLVELGTLDNRMAHFLQAAVLARLNVMVCGATDAGKTTLLRALVNTIPPQERIVTVERAAELGLRRHPDLHPNVVEWEEVLPDAEGRGGISMANSCNGRCAKTLIGSSWARCSGPRSWSC